MPMFKTELVANPNSCMVKENKQKCYALLDSYSEVSPIHTRVYNSPTEKPNLKKQSEFLHSIKGDSIDVDRCATLKYKIGRETQEYESFWVEIA